MYVKNASRSWLLLIFSCCAAAADSPAEPPAREAGGIEIKSDAEGSEPTQRSGDITRKINIGKIVNTVSGGSSRISVGAIGDTETCGESPLDGASALSQANLAGNSSLIDVADLESDNLCIAGSKNQVTIQSTTNVRTIMLMGDENVVHMHRGLKFNTLRIAGEKNKVHMPGDLSVKVTGIGKSNQLIPYQ